MNRGCAVADNVCRTKRGKILPSDFELAAFADLALLMERQLPFGAGHWHK